MYKKQYQRIGLWVGIIFTVIVCSIAFLTAPAGTERGNLRAMHGMLIMWTSPILFLSLRALGAKIGKKKDLQIQSKFDTSTVILGFIVIVYIMYTIYAAVSSV